MAYKKIDDHPRQGRPPQYLLTITDGYHSAWKKFLKEAERQNRPVSELLRQVIKEKAIEWDTQ
tara:strand:- start:1818 stop:2006 length:189 start_codon:yes stop_codon:yes gene_type:complete